MYLQVLQAPVELAVGRAELHLDLGVLVSGRPLPLLVQLVPVEVHILLELLVLERDTGWTDWSHSEYGSWTFTGCYVLAMASSIPLTI